MTADPSDPGHPREGQDAGAHDPGLAADPATALLLGVVQGMLEGLPTDGATCSWCPVCRSVDALRSTRPEVLGQLATAVGALLSAARALSAAIDLASAPPWASPEPPEPPDAPGPVAEPAAAPVAEPAAGGATTDEEPVP